MKDETRAFVSIAAVASAVVAAVVCATRFDRLNSVVQVSAEASAAATRAIRELEQEAATQRDALTNERATHARSIAELQGSIAVLQTTVRALQGSVAARGAVVAGTTVAWPSSATPPSRWLLCDGRTLETRRYESLFHAMCGSGAVADDFRVPNLGAVQVGNERFSWIIYAGAPRNIVVQILSCQLSMKPDGGGGPAVKCKLQLFDPFMAPISDEIDWSTESRHVRIEGYPLKGVPLERAYLRVVPDRELVVHMGNNETQIKSYPIIPEYTQKEVSLMGEDAVIDFDFAHQQKREAFHLELKLRVFLE